MNERHWDRNPQRELDDVALARGWFIRRHGDRRWRVYRHDQVIAELGVLYSGEWWVCPEDEALPWAQTYRSAAQAVEALVAWWQVTRPFD
ncbi:MAG TPA: hypothetical protein VGR21_10575 [Cryptosporangiaceae bacterium]|nr:hypothetical protein [Cryptosporangiaceae bacterium]